MGDIMFQMFGKKYHECYKNTIKPPYVLLVRCKTYALIANVIEASSLYIKLGAEAVHLFSSLVTSALVLNPDCTA